MTLTSIGDQARAHALSLATTRAKTTLATLTSELASGQVDDPARRLSGNTRALNEITSRIGLTRQLTVSATEAATRLQAVQDMFDGIRATTTDLGISLSADSFAEGGLLVGTGPAQAVEAFETTIHRLNGTHANRHLMSGDESGTAPLAAPAQIMDRLVALTAGLTTADAVAQAIADWFDAPAGGGGFLDEAYFGGQGPVQRITVAQGLAVGMDTTAATPAIRDLLKGLATAAIVQRGVPAGDLAERARLLTRGGNLMTFADGAVVGEMGRIGVAQQTVERAQVTNGAALVTLEGARGDLLRADPMETTTALTQVQSQLETIYAVTARLSKLRLTDFLR